jgi:hypothetical protein
MFFTISFCQSEKYPYFCSRKRKQQ